MSPGIGQARAGGGPSRCGVNQHSSRWGLCRRCPGQLHVLFRVGLECLLVRPDHWDHWRASNVDPLAPGPPVDDTIGVVRENGIPLILRPEGPSYVRHLDGIEESQIDQHDGNPERRQLPRPGEAVGYLVMAVPG